MKVPMLASAMVAMALTPGWSQAQISFPVYGEGSPKVKNVAFEEAKQSDDLRHGRLVQVNLSGGNEKPVRGVLVRRDKANGKIYVRTEPGMPPRAFAEKDIKSIEKGVIREATYKEDVTYPEIQQIVVVNGTKRSVSYVGPTLSSGERSQLTELEAAENEMVRLEYQANQETQVLETDIALQAGQLRTQELMNFLLFKQPALNYYGSPTPTPPAFMDTYNGPIITLAEQLQRTPPQMFPLGFFGPTPLPFVRVGTVFPKLGVAPDALAKARQNLLTLQTNAVYETGSLVAVIHNEPTK